MDAELSLPTDFEQSLCYSLDYDTCLSSECFLDLKINEFSIMTAQPITSLKIAPLLQVKNDSQDTKI